MKKIEIKTSFKKLLADVYTPVGIYLRLRDRFRDTILLESADSHAGDNSYSIIGINAIAGIEIKNKDVLEYKLPGQVPAKIAIKNAADVPGHLWAFMQRFETAAAEKPVDIAQGLYGYTTYDAVQFFDTIKLSTNQKPTTGNEQQETLPLMRYRLYQYVIIINHFKDELYICENLVAGMESELTVVESLIKSRDVPTFPFSVAGEETSNLTNEQYMEMVKKGIASCNRGDVFQIVLSRRFQQTFTGDEFNVYRALRSINPSPYLFYFDYGDYKLMGSSPESQLLIDNGVAIVHPIAGTFKRTGNDEMDKQLAIELENDEKENAEHVMLVDLARNDLSRMCSDVEVSDFKKINYYSHVIHMVSEVKGKVPAGSNPFKMLALSFPAGTLSGAPKFKAMQLIDEFEPTQRSYYGGAIGSIGFDGSCNHAIMIRTFLAKNNTLICQAGAGIVSASKPESELEEVNNKLNALKQAIVLAKISDMKILVFDNYDSFTYNLVHLVEKIIDDKVDVYRNDEIALEKVKAYDKIILSPGPGIPEEAGLLLPLIKEYASTKSILGVCLGHQAIGEAFGGKLINLDKVYHGVATPIKIINHESQILKGFDDTIEVGRYHSWIVSKENFPSNELEITAEDSNGYIMAMQHRKYDMQGVQFHPESVLTPDGEKMMRNWLKQ